MRILVLVENYPNNDGGVSLMYVHTRNKYYVNNGLNVQVLNFSAKISYEKDGISVITKEEYKIKQEKYDILILHAANLKHHYQFLKQYGGNFTKFIFFYHGHEILRINETYSKPYPYVSKSRIKSLLQNCYDSIKLSVWRKYLPKVKDKSYFVFVSKWMYDEFFKFTKIPEKLLEGKTFIAYNCVGELFEKESYDATAAKKYDFVTIRGMLDDSKYAVDIVNRLAFNTPEAKFVLVGKGEFFSHYKKAPNLEWCNRTMSHREIIDLLQQARYALMPTRTDAQGLMMCEMAALGIPVITSDIPVCHEVFDGFKGAFFIDNNDENRSLDSYLSLSVECGKDTRYFMKNTIGKELEIIRKAAE